MKADKSHTGGCTTAAVNEDVKAEIAGPSGSESTNERRNVDRLGGCLFRNYLRQPTELGQLVK